MHRNGCRVRGASSSKPRQCYPHSQHAARLRCDALSPYIPREQEMVKYTADNVGKDGMQTPNDKWSKAKMAKSATTCSVM